MAKVVTMKELAEIVTTLLVEPEKLGELGDPKTFHNFASHVADTVAYHCGGDVTVSPPWDTPPEDDNEPGNMYGWCVIVRGDETISDPDINVWSGYDPEGDLFEEEDDAEETAAALQADPGGDPTQR